MIAIELDVLPAQTPQLRRSQSSETCDDQQRPGPAVRGLDHALDLVDGGNVDADLELLAVARIGPDRDRAGDVLTHVPAPLGVSNERLQRAERLAPRGATHPARQQLVAKPLDERRGQRGELDARDARQDVMREQTALSLDGATPAVRALKIRQPLLRRFRHGDRLRGRRVSAAGDIDAHRCVERVGILLALERFNAAIAGLIHVIANPSLLLLAGACAPLALADTHDRTSKKPSRPEYRRKGRGLAARSTRP